MVPLASLSSIRFTPCLVIPSRCPSWAIVIFRVVRIAYTPRSGTGISLVFRNSFIFDPIVQLSCLLFLILCTIYVPFVGDM